MIELVSLDLMTNDPSLGGWSLIVIIIAVSMMVWRIGRTIRDACEPR